MKKILIVLLGFALIGGTVGYMQWNKPHKNVQKAKSDVEMSANELLAAFETDENKANSLYLDKIIKVNGVVKSIEKNDSGEITVILATNNDMSAILCNFDPMIDQSKLSLKVGESTSLKGICTGFLMDVVLERCALPQK